MKFLHDERKNVNHRERLISEKMKECQGPALWVFNNADFTDQDFENLDKLGGETKKPQTSKIGKFGLGFNAVYHLTDVPSLISRQFLKILDPHRSHLGKAGIRVDVRRGQNSKIGKLKNQFQPFEGVFGCRLASQLEAFDGTLFRFPLRTKNQASWSEISSEHYDAQRVRDLLRKLLDAADSLLLFTQNILRVSVYHLKPGAKDGSEAELMFNITREGERVLRQLPQTFPLSSVALKEDRKAQELLRATNILQAASLEMDSFRSSGGARDTKNANGLSSVVVQRISVETTLGGTSMFQGSVESTSRFWMTSNCTGRGTAFQQALKDSTVTPVGGAAFPVRVVGENITPDDDNLQSKVFCFLPLSVESQLKAHINGYFALTSNRTHLCDHASEDLNNVKAVWNEALATDPVSTAYLNLLTSIAEQCPASDFDLLMLFPCKSQTSGTISELIQKEILQRLVQNNIEVFTDGQRYASFSQVRFLCPQFRSSKLGSTALDVFRQLSDKVVVDLPEEMLQALQKANRECRVEANMFDLRRFFDEVFLPNIGAVDERQRDALIFGAAVTRKVDDLLRGKPCIPTRPHGSLMAPSDLISPSGSIGSLFEEEDERFPRLRSPVSCPSACEEQEILHALQRLGMKTDDIPWKAVLERARFVTRLEDGAAAEKSKALVQFMEMKLVRGLGCEEGVKEELRRVPFLPVMPKPKFHDVPWRGEGMKLVSPKDAYLADAKKLVCCIEPLVNNTILTRRQPAGVAAFLQLENKEVTAPQLIEQLTLIKTHWTRSPDVEEFIRETYLALQKIVQRDPASRTSVKTAFEARNLLLTQGKFTAVNKCSTDSGISTQCHPYLSEADPRDLISFRNLLEAIGVKKEFEWSDYRDALSEMKEHFGNDPLGTENNDHGTITTAHSLIQNLCAQVERSGLDVEASKLAEQIWLPDSEGVLRKCSEMSYNNCPDMAFEEDIVITHDTIPHKFAQILKMKTIREDVLQRHSCDLGVDFGQSEKLTGRLNRILTGYPRDTTILKELLQNADDAGATEIHFVLDPRSHKAEKVFEEKWKPLQGPALLVYNNKPFTEEDMSGIQNLGEGSKGSDPTKTGQYGIGFNCVYHLTDTPMFLTKGREVGETLCTFDPQCRYVPGARRDSPGRKFQDIPELKGKFPDVFSCFMEEEFPVEDATMFRFPLRTEEFQTSEIERAPVSVEEVQKLMATFHEDLPECLLFLNNLKQVTISEVDLKEGALREVYKVEATLNEYDLTRRGKFVESVKKLRDKGRGQQERQTVLYNMEINDSEGTRTVYRVGQQIGFDSSAGKIKESIRMGYKTGELALLPRGGVAVLLHGTASKTSDTHTKLKRLASRLCCFLPLPIDLELCKGVHINGHFALDYESRRTLWGPENGGLKADWNTHLMTAVIGPLYAEVLADRTNATTAKSLPNFTKLFPSTSVRNQKTLYIDVLHDAVYQSIARHSKKVLPVTRPGSKQVEWLSADSKEKVFFNGLSNCEILRIPEAKRKTGVNRTVEPFETVQETLLEFGLCLLNLPLRVHLSFTQAGARTAEVTPESVCEFFRSHSVLSSLPMPLEHTPFKHTRSLVYMLDYCLQDKGAAQPLAQKLQGLPFLATSDGQLRIFKAQNKEFRTKYSCLVSNQKEKFVHEDLVKIFSRTEDLKKTFPPLTVSSLEEMFCCDPECAFLHNKDEVLYSKEDNWNEEWLRQLWAFLAKEATDRLKKQEMSSLTKTYREDLDELLVPLANWCILPVKQDNVTKLLLLRDALAAMHDGFGLSSHLRALKKLKLPVPDFGVLRHRVDVKIYKLVKTLVATSDNPAALLMCLQKNLKRFPVGQLTVDEAQCLLRYFSDKLEEVLKVVPSGIHTLQMLPCYCTVKGDLIPLAGSCAYVIPTAMPANDMDAWTHTGGDVFLKSEVSLDKLYQVIGCLFLTETELYVKFIFPQFDMMSNDGRSAHLRFIRDRLLPRLEADHKVNGGKKAAEQRELGALINAFEDLRFMPNCNGELLTAAECCDPENPVFSAMLEKSKFPTGCFCQQDWLPFLRKIGMMCAVSPDMYLEFATELATDAVQSKLDPELVRKSTVLVSHLLDPPEIESKLHEPSFLSEICNIDFVAPEVVRPHLRTLHPQFPCARSDEAQPFTRFKGSLVGTSKTKWLTWTCASLIPSFREPLARRKGLTRKELLSLLGVAPEVTLETVVKHLKKLCGRQAREQNARCGEERKFLDDELGQCLKTAYEFLSKQSLLGSIREEDLSEIPFILVENGTRLVSPKQVVIDILEAHEIKPYLYKRPDDLGPFNDALKTLGVSKVPTAEHFVSVLAAIHAEVKEERMDPNKLYCAVKAFIGLVDAVSSGSQLAHCCELFLPSRDKRLVSSRKLIFSDDSMLEERLGQFDERLLIDRQSLTSQAVEFKESFGPQITDKLDPFAAGLPDHLRPRRLADVIKERMETTPGNNSVEDVKMSKELKDKLGAPEFVSAVLRLARHQESADGQNTNLARQEEERIRTEILKKLSGVKVIGVKQRITTFLFHEDAKIPGSETEMDMFHTQEGEGEHAQHVLYVSDDLQNSDSKWDDVAYLVDRIIGGRLKESVLRLSRILHLEPGRMAEELDRKKIKRLQEEGEETRKKCCTPTLGFTIPVEEHHLLMQDFFRFYSGEFVGEMRFCPCAVFLCWKRKTWEL